MNDDVLFPGMDEGNEGFVNGVPDGNPERPPEPKRELPQSVRTALTVVENNTRRVLLGKSDLIQFNLNEPHDCFCDGGVLSLRGQIGLCHALICWLVERGKITHTATVEDVLFNLDLELLNDLPPW